VIIQEARAGCIFQARELHPRIDWKGRRPAHDHPRHRQTFLFKLPAQRKYRLDLLLHRRLALRRTFLVIVAIVDMNASRLETGKPINRFVERHRCVPGLHAGPMLANVDVEEDIDFLLGRSQGFGQRL